MFKLDTEPNIVLLNDFIIPQQRKNVYNIYFLIFIMCTPLGSGILLSSTRFVSWKDIKQAVADLKKIYTAVTLEEAEENLLQFGEKWRKQYPSCVKSREENWEVLSTFFEYPPEIRKIILSTIRRVLISCPPILSYLIWRSR